MTPQRIQLRRSKGWRKPQNTVVVARPGKWGNPFRIDRRDDWEGGFIVVDGDDNVQEHSLTEQEARALAVQAFRDDLAAGKLRFTVEDVRRELRGKNLACWCKPTDACHADALLEVANG